MKIKKHERPTMGIKHRADSGLRKFLALNKVCFERTVMRSDMH